MWLLNLSGTEVLLVVAIFSLAATVQSSTGFGSAVIAGPFLALIDPRFVPGPLIMAGITIVTLIILRERPHGDVKEILLVTGGRVAGSVVGALLLLLLSRQSLTLLFSGLLLAAAIVSAFGLTVARSRPAITVAGFASGITGTVAGLGGAPVALMFQREKGSDLRSMLAVYLLPGGFVSLVAVLISGKLTLVEIELYLLLLPGILVGHLVSTSLRPWLDRHVSRWVVLAIAVAGSGWLFIKTMITM